VQRPPHPRPDAGAVYAYAGLAVSQDSSLLASISTDRSVKVFDVKTLDMMAMLKLPFTPSCVEWIFKVTSTPLTKPGFDHKGTAIAERTQVVY